jgi:hypothetical protein
MTNSQKYSFKPGRVSTFTVLDWQFKGRPMGAWRGNVIDLAQAETLGILDDGISTGLSWGQFDGIDFSMPIRIDGVEYRVTRQGKVMLETVFSR